MTTLSDLLRNMKPRAEQAAHAAVETVADAIHAGYLYINRDRGIGGAIEPPPRPDWLEATYEGWEPIDPNRPMEWPPRGIEGTDMSNGEPVQRRQFWLK